MTIDSTGKKTGKIFIQNSRLIQLSRFKQLMQRVKIRACAGDAAQDSRYPLGLSQVTQAIVSPMGQQQEVEQRSRCLGTSDLPVPIFVITSTGVYTNLQDR